LKHWQLLHFQKILKPLLALGWLSGAAGGEDDWVAGAAFAAGDGDL
jgi:hypothetical protein